MKRGWTLMCLLLSGRLLSGRLLSGRLLNRGLLRERFALNLRAKAGEGLLGLEVLFGALAELGDDAT